MRIAGTPDADGSKLSVLRPTCALLTPLFRSLALPSNTINTGQ
jgi:hypothetical protein